MDRVFMQFQDDVMETANRIAVQEMCAQNGIDFSQKLAQAQLVEHQKVMAYQQQKMMNRAYADYYGRGQKTSLFGAIKDVLFDNSYNERMAAAVRRQMMTEQMAALGQQTQAVQPAQPVQQAQPAQIAQPVEQVQQAQAAQQEQPVEQVQAVNEAIPFEDDARLQKLEQEVGNIKNDINELKDSMAQLLEAIKG